jgi:hypothetical protein
VRDTSCVGAGGMPLAAVAARTGTAGGTLLATAASRTGAAGVELLAATGKLVRAGVSSLTGGDAGDDVNQ